MASADLASGVRKAVLMCTIEFYGMHSYTVDCLGKNCSSSIMYEQPAEETTDDAND